MDRKEAKRSTHLPGGRSTDAEEDDLLLAPIPGTERWHHERFLRLATADPDGFDRMAAERANSAAPLEERVALLRASWKVRGKRALRWFADAFTGAAGSPDETAGALRGFVVRHLASHGSRVPEVRDFLREVFLDATASDRDRSASGRAVLRTAGPEEIARLRAAVCGISDVDAVEGALVGLGLNDRADAASALLWLSRNHPQERVRERAAEVVRRRLQGTVGETEED